MRQRGRKSAENLVAFPRVNGDPARLQPPDLLSAKERRLFVELVDACDPRHFVASDLPLICAYVQAAALSQYLVAAARKSDDALARWEKATRLMAMLATRLRLSVQSRTDPKTLARMRRPERGQAPWV
jgi:hypothetical protein